MAFIKRSGQVVSFCDVEDAFNADLRLFAENESLSEDLVYDSLAKSTQRILDRIRSTDWWKNYYIRKNGYIGMKSTADVPAVDANRIRSRYQQFGDLCVYVAFSEYVLPTVADFSNENNAEYVKIKYYADKANKLLAEIVDAGDWYDFDNNGTVASDEKQPGFLLTKRIR